jgi:hypothetical protein
MPWTVMAIGGFALSAVGVFIVFVARSNPNQDLYIRTTLGMWEPLRWLGLALGVVGAIGWVATALT